MRWAVLLAASVCLASCQSKSVSEMSYTEVKAYAQQLLERCKKQGAGPGAETQACINQEALADENRRLNAIRTQQAVGNALAAAGAGMQRSATMNRQVYCTSTPSSTWVGGPVSTVRTTCY